MALTSASLKTLGSGRYSDNAHGLYFNVKDTGARSWVQRLVIDGRRRTFGLGPYPVVSLSDARDIAIDNVRLRRRGINPIAERTRNRTVPTFAAACDAYLDLQRASWKAGSRNESNWRSSLAHAKAIHDRPVDAVETHDVIAVVSALYRDGKDATARSLRQRIRAVMEWARAEGHRTDNPADGRIDAALPKAGRETKHREAMPWRDLPTLYARLAGVTGPQRGAALALRLLILTGVRRNEARMAKWTEIDTTARVWTIPGARTKTGKAHRVPLAPAALAVLAEAKRSRCREGFVFCGARGARVTETGLLDILKAHADGAAGTVHGFRFTFRDWCGENGIAQEVAEAALAHVAGKTKRAYARSDLLDRRRPVMDEWAGHVTGETR